MQGVALYQCKVVWGPFLESPEYFRIRKAATKPRLMNTEYILTMKRGSLHTKRFRRTHLSVFRHRLIKNYFAGPKCFRDVRETGRPEGEVVWTIAIETTSSVRN